MHNWRSNYHKTIAEYFSSQQIYQDDHDHTKLNTRKLSEQPWQYMTMRAWKQLYSFIADLSTIQILGEFNWMDIRIYWTEIERNSLHRALDAYTELINDPSSNIGLAWTIALLITDLGYSQDTINLWLALADHFQQNDNLEQYPRVLLNAAENLRRDGQVQKAEQIFQKIIPIFQTTKDWFGLATTLVNLGIIKSDTRELAEAEEHFNKAEDIAQRLNNSSLLANCFGGMARIQFWKGEYQEAISLFKKEENLTAGLNNADELANCLLAQAETLRMHGQLNEAIDLMKRAEEISHKLGNKVIEAKAIGAQAIVQEIWGNWKEALNKLHIQKYLYESINDQAGLAKSLGNQAMILIRLIQKDGIHRAEDAWRLLEEQESIALKINDTTSLLAILQNKAIVLRNQGRLDEAFKLLDEKDASCRELDDLPSLASCLQEKAIILLLLNDKTSYNDAESLIVEKIEICKKLDLQRQLASGLGLLGKIKLKQSKFNEAKEHFINAIEIQRELREPVGLASNLYNLGVIYQNHLKKYDEAKRCLEESYNLAEEYQLGDLLSRFQ